MASNISRRGLRSITQLVAVTACGLVMTAFITTGQRAGGQTTFSSRTTWHSPKKGIGLGSGGGGKQWRAALRRLHVSWVYTWGLHAGARPPQKTHFVPMIWGYRPGGLHSSVSWLKKKHNAGLQNYLLTFNEPDGKHQANLTVGTALKEWPKIESTGMMLGSPACVHPDNSWMRAFMHGVAVRHYRVNFICIHWYGGPDAARFLEMLNRIHQMYRRPIWVTEFAVGDWSASRKRPNIYSPQVIARFMRIVLPAMNRMRFVQCYAWFPAQKSRYTALGTSALFHKNGSLTLLGRIYAAD